MEEGREEERERRRKGGKEGEREGGREGGKGGREGRRERKSTCTANIWQPHSPTGIPSRSACSCRSKRFIVIPPSTLSEGGNNSESRFMASNNCGHMVDTQTLLGRSHQLKIVHTSFD